MPSLFSSSGGAASFRALCRREGVESSRFGRLGISDVPRVRPYD